MSKQRFIPTTGTYPAGFSLSGTHCGVKKGNVKDLALVLSDRPCTAAAVFTQNVFKAAPVVVSRAVLDRKGNKDMRGIVVNSGCANAVTGGQGLENAQRMAKAVEGLTNCQDSTLVMSTGVIGQHLPIERIEKGIREAQTALGSSHASWLAAAEAIMTTDTFPKLQSRSYTLPSGKTFTLAGMTKGAGMIHPNMATLLGIMATDLAISAPLLQKALKHAADRSFNAISVDGDMSTNDTVAVLANGANGQAEIATEDDDFYGFRHHLTNFAASLAQLVVRDGEGATKFVTVRVKEAKSYTEAKTIASTIATSSLVKTALYGQDANWGRILCAVGYAPVQAGFNPQNVSVSFIPADGSGELALLTHGEPEAVDEERAKVVLSMDEVEICVRLGEGKEEAVMWTCDLSHEYVSINADYRS
ncbi:Arginine biosynthesis bifunctional protein ArgJ, mitochondrial [Bifiguratus adelaidae]|uniref:Arginine biosynthesis bifunctional protein ArgJ, mitochondrial n=1 Tax=Bifiguratus adelaidae TaxID=1938954 RepID=A0A261XZW4_9FUNG|nr:Arginine biosynthesis bifunctional protein ArgJ, mitochondrial [Bifiguratus adelaidae]